MKKFTVPCTFGAQTSPFTIYIGKPKKENHPIQNQAHWLSKERGGKIPPKVMDSLEKLRDLAYKNNVSFEELCLYALTAAEKQEEESIKSEANQETIIKQEEETKHVDPKHESST